MLLKDLLVYIHTLMLMLVSCCDLFQYRVLRIVKSLEQDISTMEFAAPDQAINYECKSVHEKIE